jgi:hypothetical protein
MPSPWFIGASVAMPKSYASLGCAIVCILCGSNSLGAQGTANQSGSQGTCAALLADGPGVSAIGPTGSDSSLAASASDSARSGVSSATSPGSPTSPTGSASSASAAHSDTASFALGRATNGPADIILLVGVHADQVRFATQPHVRVRFCWGGDTLRVIQRENIPSPVVAGTTYRNVYVAVELIGRLNGECLAQMIGVRSGPETSQSTASNANASPSSASSANMSPTSASSCAFLGGSAGAGAQTPRTP